MKKVLVTGATGFVGRHCLAGLQQAGYEVYAATINGPLAEPDGVVWRDVDLFDASAINQMTREIRPEALLHLAWVATPGAYSASPENLRWVQASLELFRAFAEAGGRRIVVAGTCAEYDWKTPGGHCVEMQTPVVPVTLYGVCKNALHDILRAYARQMSLEYAWGRLFFLYGPYEYPQRLVPSVICSLWEGQAASCTAGEQARDFLYVQDAADALCGLVASTIQGPVNIASGTPHTVKTVVQVLGALMDRPHLIRLGDRATSSSEPPTLTADVGRLQHIMKQFPRHDLTEGLEKTIAWWKTRLAGSGR